MHHYFVILFVIRDIHKKIKGSNKKKDIMTGKIAHGHIRYNACAQLEGVGWAYAVKHATRNRL